MPDHEGWNLVYLNLPCFGMLHLAFKGDTIRIRKADDIFIVPMEHTFEREEDNKEENIKVEINARIDSIEPETVKISKTKPLFTLFGIHMF